MLARDRLRFANKGELLSQTTKETKTYAGVRLLWRAQPRKDCPEPPGTVENIHPRTVCRYCSKEQAGQPMCLRTNPARGVEDCARQAKMKYSRPGPRIG
jgi:hypothetical protein